MMSIPNNNQNVPVADLVALNTALRKAASVGYQTGATTSAGDTGTFSPLVPQSIESVLASATYTMKQLSLWKRIPKRDVTQTLHEYSVVKEHGADLDPFFAEGSVPATNRSEYERKSVRIKYLAERREVTDVATMVGLIGANRNALAEETERGTIRLLQRTERAIFHGDSDVNPLAFDGIFKQIEDNAPSNVTDLAGSAPTVDLLQEMLGELYGAPNYGDVDAIYVEPRIHSELIRQTVSHGRHDQLSIQDGSKLTWGAKELCVMSPYGPVPIVSAPFLYNKWPVPTNLAKTAARDFGVGDTIPTTPTLSVAIAAGAAGASQFNAADAGTYTYFIEAVGTKGVSAFLTTAGVAVVAGDQVTFTIAGAPAILPAYYRIFRSAKDGTYATAELMQTVVYGGAGGTAIVDNNVDKPGTSKILAIKHDPQIFEWVKLLDYMRRPLAEVETTKPFMLMLFGAPIVKVPTKTWVLKNAGVNSAGL
jgi:hypothetical protein